MKQIAIVTDSAGDLPPDLAEEYQIKVVPLNICFAEETYQDGINLSSKEFYHKLKNSASLPKTSQPAPGEFVRVYQNLLAQNKQIISIHLSSTLSGTYQSARMAKEMLPEGDIEVIDSFSASMGCGLMALEAAQMVEAGRNKEEIIARVEKLKNSMRLIGVIDTLEYLHKGGRIGKAQALLGFLLNVKPLLIFRNGELDSLGKARGRGKAWQILLEHMKEEIKPEDAIRASVMHGQALEEAKKVEGMLRDNFNCQEIIITCMGSTIGTHLGPGIVALAYYKID